MENYKADVNVYNKKIFINTEDGTGFEDVLNSMSPLINSMSKKYSLPNHDYYDMKNLISVIALEGIHSYIPNDNLKLSSYLTTYIKNKVITKIVLNNTQKKDAVFLKITDNKEKNKIARHPISMSTISNKTDDDDNYFDITSIKSDLFRKDNELIFQDYFSKVLEEITDEDLEDSKIRPIVKKYIELIYFDGYTLKKITREFGEKYHELVRDIKKLSNLPKIKNLMDIYKDNYLDIYNEA